MIEEVVGVPDGLKSGRVIVRGNRLAGTSEVGIPSNSFLPPTVFSTARLPGCGICWTTAIRGGCPALRAAWAEGSCTADSQDAIVHPTVGSGFGWRRFCNVPARVPTDLLH